MSKAISWSEIHPDLELVSHEDANTFMKEWFNPRDLIRVTLKQGTAAKAQTVRGYELMTLTDQDMKAMTAGNTNVYFNISPTKKVIESIHKRGGKENCVGIRGLFADIDLKAGSFESEAEILEWVDSLPMKPTLVVGSGSGGCHLYWKASQDIPLENEEIQAMWWAYLQELAGERSIDRLIDPSSRMLRIPGTVRYKNDQMGPVKLLRSGGPTYSYLDFFSASEVAYRGYEKQKKVTHKVESAREVHLGKLMQTEGFGSHLFAIAYMDEWINENLSWPQILEPYGWCDPIQLRDCVQWRRPGFNSSPRSATTNFYDSPNTMSLLSSSPETKLDDLKRDDVPLTKRRVVLRLWFNDKEDEMVKYFLPYMMKPQTQESE